MLLNLALVIASLPVLAWTTYLASLALLSRVNPTPSYGAAPRTMFDVIVPAHNEEVGIAATRWSTASRRPWQMERPVPWWSSMRIRK